MVNWNNSLIYKLFSKKIHKIYIGYTTRKKYRGRLSDHKNDYKRYLKNEFDYVTSFELVKFKDVDIEIIERYPCKTRKEIVQRENYWIDYYRDICVNKNTKEITNDKIKTVIIYKLFTSKTDKV